MLLPRSYTGGRVERTDHGDAIIVSLDHGRGVAEDDGLTWPAILAAGDDAGLRSAVQCLARRGRVDRIDPVGGAAASWRVWLDPEAEPVGQADEVTLTEFSTGAGFHFERRG